MEVRVGKISREGRIRGGTRPPQTNWVADDKDVGIFCGVFGYIVIFLIA